jgi:hypothetical protein
MATTAMQVSRCRLISSMTRTAPRPRRGGCGINARATGINMALARLGLREPHQFVS